MSPKRQHSGKDPEKKEDLKVVVHLTLGERFLILELLPEKMEDILTVRAVKELNLLMVPSEEEVEEYEITPGTVGSVCEACGHSTERQAGLKWPPEAAKARATIQISPKQFEIVDKALRGLETKKALELRHESLWSQFIEKVSPIEEENDEDESEAAA